MRPTYNKIEDKQTPGMARNKEHTYSNTQTVRCFSFFFLKGLLCPLFVIIKIFIYLLLQRGERREKERERNRDQLPLSHLQLGTYPATQACALTGNQTSSFSVCRPALNLLSHTSWGINIVFSLILSLTHTNSCSHICV